VPLVDLTPLPENAQVVPNLHTRLAPFIQGRTLDELHDHEELILQAKRCAQARPIGMIQTCEQLDFANEAVREFRVFGKIGQQDLQGIDAVGNGVLDLINLPHPACAQQADNLIIPPPLSPTWKLIVDLPPGKNPLLHRQHGVTYLGRRWPGIRTRGRGLIRLGNRHIA